MTQLSNALVTKFMSAGGDINMLVREIRKAPPGTHPGKAYITKFLKASKKRSAPLTLTPREVDITDADDAKMVVTHLRELLKRHNIYKHGEISIFNNKLKTGRSVKVYSEVLDEKRLALINQHLKTTFGLEEGVDYKVRKKEGRGRPYYASGSYIFFFKGMV